MNVILFDQKTGHSRPVRFPAAVLMLAVVLLLAVTAAGGVAAGYFLKGNVVASDGDLTILLKQDIANNAESIKQAQQSAEGHVSAMTVRMAELQARLMRLDALGERLVDVANLKGGEFEFSEVPAVGGPEEGEMGIEVERPSFLKDLDQLASDVETRERQLEVLESLLENRKIQKEVALAGRPITWGWLSSRFGRRNDPFTGRVAWHSGVDFAGKDGSDIVSVGGGVVTWAGERYGYGLMVEVSHGGGYATRYAHAKEIEVQVGDIVKQGQVLAKMGSTGRSTGPHVHFEVRKNGKAVDPSRYVLRKRT
ncbi:M23 family metallopeptidase [Ketobacter sp. MCCC 1A13808]|uniref:M23 family metallopeptidase n=1 Tax=Ketobacter sp. MCCC 1A13808 TaxID=2602738 RepID=UPI0012EC4B4E|nr:M23 family metallopeptidase [Ketobacter sp. MCCC 1A13808]MVF11196.1 M23 family metallopeptidase [Ketobacter sp. MCCC 1A13808]